MVGFGDGGVFEESRLGMGSEQARSQISFSAGGPGRTKGRPAVFAPGNPASHKRFRFSHVCLSDLSKNRDGAFGKTEQDEERAPLSAALGASTGSRRKDRDKICRAQARR